MRAFQKRLNKLSGGTVLYHKQRYKYAMLYEQSFSEELLEIVENIDSYLTHAKQFYKNQPNDTTTVALIECNNKQFIIKRYNFRSVWHFIKLQFRKSHALRSYYFAKWLPLKDIPCIKPIAAVQKKIGFLKSRSYFISEYKQGIPGCVYFKKKQEGWLETANGIFDILKNMRKNNVYHGDFHFGNFVISNRKPFLLDFDRIKCIHAAKYEKYHRKDILNFNRYLVRNLKAQQFFAVMPQFFDLLP